MFVHTVIMVIEPHMKQGRQHKLISTIFLATSVTKKLDHNSALSDISDLVNEATFCTEDVFHRISGAQITAECNIPSVKVIIEDSELSSK